MHAGTPARAWTRAHAGARQGGEQPMIGLRERVRHELRQLIPVTLFFLVSFQLLALTKALMLGAYGIRVTTFFGALVAALVVAKVVVIADHLPFVNRFPDKPLI